MKKKRNNTKSKTFFLLASKCADKGANEQIHKEETERSNPSDPESVPILSHKERRRTAYMNAAFDALRRCLPDIPPDTKVRAATVVPLTSPSPP